MVGVISGYFSGVGNLVGVVSFILVRLLRCYLG